MLNYDYRAGLSLSNAEFEAQLAVIRRHRAQMEADRMEIRQMHIATRGVSTEHALGIHNRVAAMGVRPEIADIVHVFERENGRYPTFSELLRRLWRPTSRARIGIR